MANEVETISYIKLSDGLDHPIDAVTVGGKAASTFQESNIVTALTASATDSQYPSAKCMYNIIGELEARLNNI